MVCVCVCTRYVWCGFVSAVDVTSIHLLDGLTLSVLCCFLLHLRRIVESVDGGCCSRIVLLCDVMCCVVLCRVLYFIEKVSDVRISLIIKTIFSGLKWINLLLSVMWCRYKILTTMRWTYMNDEKRKAEKRREEGRVENTKTWRLWKRSILKIDFHEVQVSVDIVIKLAEIKNCRWYIDIDR